METLSRTTLSVLTCALALAGNVATAQTLAGGSFDVSFALSQNDTGPVRLDVSTSAGKIVVRQGPPGQIRVAGQIEVRALNGRTQQDADEIVRGLKAAPPVVVEHADVRVGLESTQQQNIAISYQIDVPLATEVVSHTSAGAQDIADVAGPVRAEAAAGAIMLAGIGGSVQATTESGAIRADAIAGGFDARTGSGSIYLRQVAPGDVRVVVGSGKIELHGINGALYARSRSGGITVEGFQTGPWDIAASAGNVQVTLPATAAFALDASARAGSISTSHSVDMTAPGTRTKLAGQVRGGGNLLRLHTGAGRIRID